MRTGQLGSSCITAKSKEWKRGFLSSQLANSGKLLKSKDLSFSLMHWMPEALLECCVVAHWVAVASVALQRCNFAAMKGIYDELVAISVNWNALQ
jgi:hypothetical protein